MRLTTLFLSMATAIGLVVVPAVLPATLASVTVMSSMAAAETTSVTVAPTNKGILSPADTQLTLTAKISNSTTTVIPAGTASVYLDRGVVGSRTNLSSWLETDTPVSAERLGSIIASLPTPEIPTGVSVTFPLVIPAADFALTTDTVWGPRMIAVTVSSGGAAIGQSRTSIVFNTSSEVTPVALAVAVPITVPASGVGLISADTLITDTGVDGLLTRELDQAINRRAAIGIDPMIIASIRILGPNGPPEPIAWLQRLQQSSNEIFPLSYADSDLAAARQAGAPHLLVPTSFPINPKLFPGSTAAPTVSPTSVPTVTPTPNPTETSRPAIPTVATLSRWSYTPSLAKLAWPMDDSVVGADLDAFGTGGLTTSILSSGNVSYGKLDYTPSAATLVAKHSAIVSDSQLSALLRAAAAAPDDVTWGRDFANLSAALAVVSRERADPRSLLATLGRADPGSNTRLTQTLEALSALPWAGIAQLSDFTAAAANPVSATLIPRPEPPARIATVRRLLASETQVGSFTSILDDPTVVTGERRLSLLAVLANSWNSELPAWDAAAHTYLADSSTLLNSVKIAKQGSLFVPARAVSLVVSVTNDLAYPVTVYVTVTSPRGVIRVEEPRVELRVEANSQAKSSIPVRSLANGQVTVLASLTSKTDVPIGTARAVDVEVQAGWETALTAIVAVLVVALFGFGIYRSVARRRKARGTAGLQSRTDDASEAPGQRQPNETSPHE